LIIIKYSTRSKKSLTNYRFEAIDESIDTYVYLYKIRIKGIGLLPHTRCTPNR